MQRIRKNSRNFLHDSRNFKTSVDGRARRSGLVEETSREVEQKGEETDDRNKDNRHCRPAHGPREGGRGQGVAPGEPHTEFPEQRKFASQSPQAPNTQQHTHTETLRDTYTDTHQTDTHTHIPTHKHTQPCIESCTKTDIHKDRRTHIHTCTDTHKPT